MSHNGPLTTRNTELKVPYAVERRPDQIMQTYLDTMGRPVITVTSNNLVEQHIQDFEVRIYIGFN